MNDLFIDIMMNLTSELYQNGEKDINSMLLEQKQNRDSLLQAIASIILFKPVKNEFMELSNKDYFESKKALDKLIKDNFTIEAKSEVKALDKIIEKTAKDKWGINDYVTNLGKDAGVKPIDKKVIDKIKNDKVAGKTAKSRIWNNKDEVYKHTQKRVDEFLKGKISVNDIEKEIKTLYNSNAYNTKRLVNDQIARAQAKANEEWFKENDVEWLLYDATLDGKTCSDCSGLDGKTYERDKARPPIPKHVGCRCCYIGLPDKDWRPDKRLDQITGENIDYKKYDEWYNEGAHKIGNNSKVTIGNNIKEDLESVKRCEKFAKEVLGVNSVDFKGIKNAEILESFLNELDMLKKDYKDMFSRIETMDLEEKTIAQVNGGMLQLNQRYFNDSIEFYKLVDYWQSNKFIPKGCNNIKYIATHEYMHLLTQHQIDDKNSIINKICNLATKEDIVSINSTKDRYEFVADLLAVNRVTGCKKRIIKKLSREIERK